LGVYYGKEKGQERNGKMKEKKRKGKKRDWGSSNAGRSQKRLASSGEAGRMKIRSAKQKKIELPGRSQKNREEERSLKPSPEKVEKKSVGTWQGKREEVRNRDTTSMSQISKSF